LRYVPHNAGEWACTSAVIRDGMLAMMQDRPSEEKKSSAFASVTLAAKRGASPTSATWTPRLCKVAMPYLPSHDQSKRCKVVGWHMKEFAELRNLWPGMNTKFYNSILSGPLVNLNPGAGKSGSSFASFADGKFKVKLGLKVGEVNPQKMFLSEVDEPAQLKNLMSASSSPSLIQHIKENRNSLLNKHLGLLNIEFGDRSQYAAVLEDAFYEMDSRAEEQHLKFTRYDLKGASRSEKSDAEAEADAGSNEWCKQNGAFKLLERNTMHLRDEQCLKFRRAVQADSTFLQKSGMIDYSLLLLSAHKTDAKQLCGELEQPFCFETETHLYTVSIIDYLNNLNLAKRAENVFSKWKFTKYDKKMNFFAQRICRTAAEKNLRQRVLDIPAGETGNFWNLVCEEIVPLEDRFQAEEEKTKVLTKGEIGVWLQKQGFSAKEVKEILDRHMGSISSAACPPETKD